MEINTKPFCVVSDLDSTITTRGFKESYKKVNFEEEFCQEWVCRVLDSLTKDYPLIIVTGRSEKYREDTEKWLRERHIRFDKLVMRDLSSTETGMEYKLRVVKEVSKEFNILVIFEDRRKYNEMFRSEGFNVMSVADNNF